MVFQQIRDKKIEDGNFWRLIGMEIVELVEGKAVLIVKPSKNILQVYNKVHGGVIATVIDSSIAMAAQSLLSPHEGTNTVEMNLNYLRPSEEDTAIIATAEIIQKGKSIMVGQSFVKSEAGTEIAVGRATLIIKDIHSFS